MSRVKLDQLVLRTFIPSSSRHYFRRTALISFAAPRTRTCRRRCGATSCRAGTISRLSGVAQVTLPIVGPPAAKVGFNFHLLTSELVPDGDMVPTPGKHDSTGAAAPVALLRGVLRFGGHRKFEGIFIIVVTFRRNS